MFERTSEDKFPNDKSPDDKDKACAEVPQAAVGKLSFTTFRFKVLIKVFKKLQSSGYGCLA